MSSDSVDTRLANEDIPLCFDTNAIFGKVSSELFLRSVRVRFPRRKLLIPVNTVAERARQLRAEKGDAFRVSDIRAFLDSPDLGLEVVGFDREVALNGWLAVTGGFRNQDWEWEERPVPRKRSEQPCAERCRTGDHMVYAVARSQDALLVTEDKMLLAQVARDGMPPGAIKTSELKTFVAFGIPGVPSG